VNELLHSHLIWYVNRGTGVVLVAALTLSTALGVLAVRGGSTRWPRFALQTLHRNVSLLASALLLAHAASPVLDTYVNHYAPIAPLDVVVPFVSGYKPLALGLGTVAFDVIVVIVLTSAVRRRLGHRAWFGVHLLSYASWVLGVAHGLLIGTDAWTTWNLAVTGTSVAVVLAAVAVRLLGRGAPHPAQQPAQQPAEQPAQRPAARRPGTGLGPEPEPFFPPEPVPPADVFVPAAPAVAAVPADRPMTRRDRRRAEQLLEAALQSIDPTVPELPTPPSGTELPTRRSRRRTTA
jgi:sulfoxide reductase heme-binding subunit YedZ